MIIFGDFILAMVLLVFRAVSEGYVLTVLWGWFIAPVFGLPQLTIPAAISVAIVVEHVTVRETHIGKSEDASSGDVMRKFLNSIFRSAVTLLVGWIVHLYL